jgi:hypothetical protein
VQQKADAFEFDIHVMSICLKEGAWKVATITDYGRHIHQGTLGN